MSKDPFTTPEDRADVGPVFRAAVEPGWNSDCGDCGSLMMEGDRVRYVEGEVCCDQCWPEGYEDE